MNLPKQGAKRGNFSWYSHSCRHLQIPVTYLDRLYIVPKRKAQERCGEKSQSTDLVGPWLKHVPLTPRAGRRMC